MHTIPRSSSPRRPAFRLPMAPWRDRAGRLSAVKAVTLAGLTLPGLWTLSQLLLGHFSALATEFLIEETGAWAIRILVLSLAITPLRRVLDWPQIMLVRRMVGVAAFVYAALHIASYIADQKFDLLRVASEIVLRTYLTIGFIGLALLTALAATSTDAMIKRLGGRRWRLLHKSAYAAGGLAIFHQAMQFKLPEAEPTILAALFAWLMAYRVLSRRLDIGGSPVRLVLLSIAIALLTAVGEATWIRLATGADPLLVLAANLDIAFGFRPAWYVLAAGLAVTLASILRSTLRMVRSPILH